MNDKNKKKLLENYYRYNYCFNNFCKIKKSSKKKNIIKNNTASMKIIETTSNELTIKKLNFNRTQPNLSRKIKINKKQFNRNISNIFWNKESFTNRANDKEKKIKNIQKKNSIKSPNMYFSYLNDESILKDDNERLIKSNGRFIEIKKIE